MDHAFHAEQPGQPLYRVHSLLQILVGHAGPLVGVKILKATVRLVQGGRPSFKSHSPPRVKRFMRELTPLLNHQSKVYNRQ